MLRHLDLFSGIGGFALAARMVGGYETVGFCEIEPYCQAVLRKHWPGVPIYDDVRRLNAVTAIGPVDIITGGFPCQDISIAGEGRGIEGERSGLWREYHRLIRELRPRYALVENVAALTRRGLGRVLGDLADIGYDAEWDCIRASDLGAPHERNRVWIVAYPNVWQQPNWRTSPLRRRVALETHGAGGRDIADTDGLRELQPSGRVSDIGRRLVHRAQAERSWSEHWLDRLTALCGVDDGVSRRLDESKPLGNSIVPQVAAIFLEAIKRCHKTDNSVGLATT
jgi:DNA (cytosine-5)-methyltransferase 1